MADRSAIVALDIKSSEPDQDSDKPSSVVDAARKFYSIASSATNRQGQRERDDLRFQINEPEYQWDTWARQQRSAQTVAGQAIPPRPMLCVDTLSEPIGLVQNAQRSAHLGINVHPLTEDATDDTAEVLQGLYRHIEVCSRAHLARSWAFDRGIKCGRGIYRIRTEYDPESPVPGDQRILIDRILYQDSVFLDPWAQQPDWSDGMEALVVEAMPLEKFKRDYPDSQVANFEADQYRSACTQWPDWFSQTGEQQVVIVAEYYRIKIQSEPFPVRDWKTGIDRIATREKRILFYSKVNGAEELEKEREEPGQYIPLIPFIGRELQPVDGERHWTGMIRPAKDGARLTNYAASGAVEMAALEPKAPWIMEEGQDEGYKTMWEQSNTVNFPSLKYRRIGLSGLPAPPPQRVQVDVSRLSPSMALLGMGRDFVQSATATYDPSLGKQPNAHRSGRALIALQDQSTEATSGYLGNLAEITMPYEAKVVLDLIPHIYDRPGRLATILDENLKPSQVYLNAPFEPNNAGKPRLLPYGTPQEQQTTDAQVANDQHPAKVYDLSKGRYGVSITVGKSASSRLQAGSDALSQIIESDPNLMQLIGPEWMQFQDFPGSKTVQTVLKKYRDHQFPFLQDPQQQNAQQQQQQLAQLQQQVQEMSAQLQQAQQIIQTKQVEGQTKIEQEKMRGEYDMAKERLHAETQIAVAEINKRADVFREERERIGLQLDAAKSVAHESHQAAQDRLHEATEGDKSRAHEAAMSAMEHAQTLEQTAHEAALAPEPAPAGESNAE